LSPSLKEMEKKIKNLQNQVNSLQQKIIELEKNQSLNLKKAISELLKRPQAFETSEQGDS